MTEKKTTAKKTEKAGAKETAKRKSVKKTTKKRVVNTTKMKKRKFLSAFSSCMANVSQACAHIGISRNTFYTWMNEDPEFANDVHMVEEENVDYAESKLYQLIRDGNVAATLFLLKTKGKKRGYIEGQEITAEVKATVAEDLSALTDDEVEALAKLHKKMRQAKK